MITTLFPMYTETSGMGISDLRDPIGSEGTTASSAIALVYLPLSQSPNMGDEATTTYQTADKGMRSGHPCAGSTRKKERSTCN